VWGYDNKIMNRSGKRNMTTKNDLPPSYDKIMQPTMNENPPSYHDAVFSGNLDRNTIIDKLKDLCKNEITKSKKRMDEIPFGTMFAMSKEDVMKLEKRSEIVFVDYIKRAMQRWDTSRITYLVAHKNPNSLCYTDPDDETFPFETIWAIKSDTTYGGLMTILDNSRTTDGDSCTN